MKRLTFAASLGLLAAAPAHAQGWQFLPAAEPGYEARPTFAFMTGAQDYDDGDSDAIYGMELGLACPTLKPPQGRIRQQISLSRYDEGGLETTSLEINPHYLIDIQPGLAVGFGPGLGYVWADARRGSDSVLAFQGGTSLHYRTGPLFFGAEARYQITQDADFGRGGGDLDNFRVTAKFGAAF
jgi:hypothetical protein